MHIFDTHCHYNLDPLATNWEAHWSKAQTAGVTHSIIVGTDIESSQMALTQAKSQKQLFASVGIHPGSLEDIFHPEMKPRDIEVILEKLTLKRSAGSVQRRRLRTPAGVPASATSRPT